MAKTERVQAKSLILATGAREYLQPIPGWTTHGVIGLAGATALFKQNLTLPGKRIVVSGTGPFGVLRRQRNPAALWRGCWRLSRQYARRLAARFSAMLAKPQLLARGTLWMADLTLGARANLLGARRNGSVG